MLVMNTNKKIAIIGTGISGLGAASLISPYHDITVYEKNAYIGGHSRTIEVKTNEGLIPVDTGFIVFNERNYPHLTKLFKYLDVPVAKSDMSFGTTIADGWLEYGTRNVFGFFAQTKNFFRPAYWKMIADIIKFNKNAKFYLNKNPSFTLGECLDELKLGSWFRNYYLLAMGGAIWSTPVKDMMKFPACNFIRFFENHGLLTINDHPQWYTVKGGSREYVRRLVAPFKHKILLECGAASVWREKDGVVVEDTQGNRNHYDEVVFACHADQALSLIKDTTEEENMILSAFTYQPNHAVLHSDTSFMPKRKKAWASWIYLSEETIDKSSNMCLSYWMNNLQPLKTEQSVIVTLNPCRDPKPELVHDEYIFEHPVFDETAIRGQSRIDVIQGKNKLWFCGAYQKYGFHEDGLASAVSMVEKMGITPPW